MKLKVSKLILPNGDPRMVSGELVTGKKEAVSSSKPQESVIGEASSAGKENIRLTKPHKLATWNVRGMGGGETGHSQTRNGSVGNKCPRY